MELGRILDSQKAAEHQQQHHQLHHHHHHHQPQQIQPQNGRAPIADCSGDYTLPAPLCLAQKELLDTVVSAHYSELLGFLDTDNLTHKYTKDLIKMLAEIQQVTTHPWLLLDFQRPANLFTRDMPHRIGELSGKFEVLGRLVRATRELGLHIAVLVGDANLADLAEGYLTDKTHNLFRYANGKTINHPPPEQSFVASSSCYHIVPTRLEELVASVNFAFDFMIVMDDTFDLASSYAQGIRAQLRDPSKRAPLAPLVRLIPLGSVNHVLPYMDPAVLDRETLTAVLGSTVVLAQDAGVIPAELEYLYDSDFRDMTPWFQNADRPWPLARPEPTPRYRPTDVEQVILAHEKTSDPGAKRIKLESAENDDGDTAMADAPATGNSVLTRAVFRRIQELVEQNASFKTEAESLRETASRRQAVLEEVQASMAALVEENNSHKRRRDDGDRKIAKYRADYERAEDSLRTMREEFEKAHQEAPADDKAAQLLAKTVEAQELREEVSRLRERAEQHDKDVEYMRQQYQNASSAANEAEQERQRLQGEIARLQQNCNETAVKMREATVRAETSVLEDQIASLRSELSNALDSVRILSESKTSVSTRDRNRLNRSTAAAANSSSGPRSRSGTPST